MPVAAVTGVMMEELDAGVGVLFVLLETPEVPAMLDTLDMDEEDEETAEDEEGSAMMTEMLSVPVVRVADNVLVVAGLVFPSVETAEDTRPVEERPKLLRKPVDETELVPLRMLVDMVPVIIETVDVLIIIVLARILPELEDIVIVVVFVRLLLELVDMME